VGLLAIVDRKFVEADRKFVQIDRKFAIDLNKFAIGFQRENNKSAALWPRLWVLVESGSRWVDNLTGPPLQAGPLPLHTSPYAFPSVLETHSR
jgi:hypothetical protein